MPAWARRAAWSLGAAAFVAAAVRADLWLRARSACLEGDRYMAWHGDPSAKRAWFAAAFGAEKAALDADLAAGRFAAAEHAERVELAEFRRDERAAESSLKHAYHWYKTAVELFAPPESRWTARARRGMAEAKRLWKAELDAAKIPYDEAMLE